MASPRASLAWIGRSHTVDLDLEQAEVLSNATSESNSNSNESNSVNFATPQPDSDINNVGGMDPRLFAQHVANSAEESPRSAIKAKNLRYSPLPSSKINQEEIQAIVRESSAKFIHLPMHQVSLHSSVKTLCFAHSRSLPNLQTELEKLFVLERKLLVLELRRKITSRLKELALLADQIEKIKNQEYFQLQDHKQHGSGTIVNSKIECVYALCERLRTTVNQLHQIRLYVQQNPSLQECLETVRPILVTYMDKFNLLLTQALSYSCDFIYAGLRVLSFTDLNKYSNEDLFEISRGIEEYNTILDLVKSHKRLRISNFISTNSSSCLSFDHFLSPSLSVENLKSISFTKILGCLARERAAIPVESMHDFYFKNRELIRFLRSQTQESAQNFLRVPSNPSPDNTHTSSPRHVKLKSKTSDYYSDEVSSIQQQSDQAEIKLSRFIEKLTNSGSPVSEYIRVEYDFASGFLDCVAQSTQLLPNHRPSSRRRLKKDETIENLSSVLNTNPPANEENSRKGVRWSDHSEVTIRHHVVAKYLDLVWKEVGSQFIYYMSHLLWTKNNEEISVNSQLGTFLLLDPAALQILSYVVQFTANESLFPSNPASLLTFLHSLSLHLHLCSCHSLWEGNFSKFLGLKNRQDSIYPTLLEKTLQCSRLGKAFLDSLKPCLKAISLSVNELDSWLKGRRITTQLVTASQLEPLLNDLSDWLALSVTTSFSFLRTMTDVVPNQFRNDNIGQGIFMVLTDLSLVELELKSAAALFDRLQHIPPHFSQVKAEMASFRNLLVQLESTKTDLHRLYSDTCLRRAKKHIRETFPTSRQSWKMDHLDLDCLEPQVYVHTLFSNYFETIVKPLGGLHDDLKFEGLSVPVVALATAWSAIILRGKIRFNSFGARQLEADVNAVPDYLDRVCESHDLTDKLMRLDAVRELRAGVRLLRRQPVSRAASCGSLPCTELQVYPSGTPLHSLSDAEKQVEEDGELLDNRDHWLSLRSNGKRKFVAICS